MTWEEWLRRHGGIGADRSAEPQVEHVGELRARPHSRANSKLPVAEKRLTELANLLGYSLDEAERDFWNSRKLREECIFIRLSILPGFIRSVRRLNLPAEEKARLCEAIQKEIALALGIEVSDGTR